jgi:hypothetical protein
MERIRDHWDGQQVGCLPYVYHGPAALVVLQREVAKDAGLRTYPLEEALGNRLTVHVFPAQMQHDHRVGVADGVEDAGHVTQFGQTGLSHLGPQAAGLKKLPGVHAKADVRRTSQLPDFS